MNALLGTDQLDCLGTDWHVGGRVRRCMASPLELGRVLIEVKRVFASFAKPKRARR
jgi:hypothetical protein